METFYENKEMQGLYEKVERIIAETIPASKGRISPEKLLVRDLGADSLNLVDLVMSAEQTLGIRFADAEVYSLKTVDDCVNMAYGKVSKAK
jgi:acyl carrier protein